MDVIVYYSGKRLPWTISMPWLSVKPVTFGEDRQATMPIVDAERLCKDAPTDFRIVGPAAAADEEAASPATEEQPEKIPVAKPSPIKRRRKTRSKTEWQP